jgi:hypothetical protein
MNNSNLFKKVIPTDFVPTVPGPIAATTYKGLEWIGDEMFFIRYYNCGVHYSTFEVAREKYNSLTAVKR